MPLNGARGRRQGRPARGAARWLGRAAGAAALAALALAATASPALAHADLASSSPANLARLSAEPHQVVLVYTEDVEIALSNITVVAPDGTRVAEEPLRRAGGRANTLTASLRPSQAHGTYVLDWRTVASDDGHVTAGGLTFYVGAPSKVAPVPVAGGGTGGSQATSVALDVMAWLGFAGFALLAGCAAIRLACLPPGSAAGDRAAWPAAAGWLVLLLATLGQLLLDGPYTAGLGPAHLLDRSLLGTTVSTHLGHALMVRIGLLALVAVVGDHAMRRAAAARPRGWSTAAAALLAAGLAATWSATSHAASGGLAAVALPVEAAHVAAMGLWAGGLFTLGLCLLRPQVTARPASGPPGSGPPGSGLPAARPGGTRADALAGAAGPLVAEAAMVQTAGAGDVGDLRVAVRRFSDLALTSVITLAVTGGYLAVREVGSLGALAGTSYGRLVLAKAALLVAVIAVASRSRRHVRQRLGEAITGLRRTVLVELAGACLLLAVATVLINTAPPRPGAGALPAPSAAAPSGRGPLAIPAPRGPGSAIIPPEDAVRVRLRSLPGSEPAATAGRGRTDVERDGCGPPLATGCRHR
jgi:copper transport protein